MVAHSQWYVEPLWRTRRDSPVRALLCPLRTALHGDDTLLAWHRACSASKTAAHINEPMSHDSPSKSPEAPRVSSSKGDKYDVYDANIRNFAPVARIMKNALPENAKIAKEAKECMQECVSEFISFITSEGQASCVLLMRGVDRPWEADLSQLRRNVTRRSGKQSTARTSSSP